MKINFIQEIKCSVAKRVAAIPHVKELRPNTLDFCNIFKEIQNPIVIAEVKFGSPSKGIIYDGGLNPVSIATQYLEAGAAAISVLTEPEYFKGDISYLKNIRLNFKNAHILMKDFILSKKQIEEGLLCGANAVLLIVCFLDDALLKELYEYSIYLGLTPIVEIHDLKELERILPLSPIVIGVNNRNLKNLEINLNIARDLIKKIPQSSYVICESGIENLYQIHEMIDLGFDGFLIGSSLMKNNNPGEALKKLLEK